MLVLSPWQFSSAVRYNLEMIQKKKIEFLE